MRCRPTPRSWSSGSATSSATGGSCCIPRTAYRCTRRGRSRSPRASASGSASTDPRWRATTASSCGCPRRMPNRPARSCSSSRRTSSTSWSPPRSAARRCSPRGSASPPRARCCCRATTPAAAPRSGSSGSGRAQLLEVARKYPSFPIILETVREVLQDVYDLPALVGARPRRSRAARSASSRSRPSRRRRSPARCCSDMSLRSCTRATRRWPNVAPPRCQPRPDPARRAARPRGAARAARPGRHRADRARAAAPRARPPRARTSRVSSTCCGCSGRCRRTSWSRGRPERGANCRLDRPRRRSRPH